MRGSVEGGNVVGERSIGGCVSGTSSISSLITSAIDLVVESGATLLAAFITHVIGVINVSIRDCSELGIRQITNIITGIETFIVLALNE